MCRQSTTDKYSVAVLASGGLLDTLAAIRSGLMPIWGSDTDTSMQALWKDLVGTDSYGDAFSIDLSTIRRPKILKTGFPCPNYCSLGDGTGMEGSTGYLYVKQAEIILQLSPDVAIIEQTDGVLNIEGGKAAHTLINELSTQYHVHHSTVPVWAYGDVSHRKRFIIVAINKRLGAAGRSYQFPAAIYNQQYYPTAADVAVPDKEVPDGYILDGEPTEIFTWQQPEPGQIHRIGQYGEGAGNCDRPHPLHSWCGLPNTQLTTNGGGRRVMLSWQPGQQINQTRLTVPVETVRMASLSQTYLQWLRQFSSSDCFLRLCVNNGVPMRTSTIIDQSVIQVLQKAGIKPDIPASHADSPCNCPGQCGDMTACSTQNKNQKAHRHNEYDYVRSQLVDTGATGSLNYTDIEWAMQQSRPSQYQIAVAKGDTMMQGSRDGLLRIFVLNTTAQPGFEYSTPFETKTTTVPGLRSELLSLDGPYRHGRWNMMLRQPDFESGVNELYRAAKDGIAEARIPLRYDYTGPGGWWIDYVVQGETAAYQTLMKRHHEDSVRFNSAVRAADLMRACYDTDTANQLWQQISANESVTQTIIAQEGEVIITARHPDERQVKGVKSGLKHGKQKMPYMMFHKKHGHIGNADDNCAICRMIKGAMRRITKKVDPHRDTRVGHTWTMDTITFSHRSLEGSKYLIVLRDKASGVFYLLPLYLRSDAPASIEQWIMQMRADPAYSGLPYQAVSLIITDNAGEWDRKSKQWQAMRLRVKNLELNYVTPETSKEAGAAERANGIVEECIKAVLMEQNLPPDHWQAAARNSEFLLNRFPNLSTDVTAAVDGDQARPLEIITRGRYSRRQIDRELSYFVQVGTVGLIHNKHVKGSTLAPKVRWGVAMGMYREQVVWMCPFTRSTFRCKSFTAFDLKDGMNYAQFLGLPEMESTRKALSIPGDDRVSIDVHLLPARQVGEKGMPPVVRLRCATDKGVQSIDLPADSTGQQPAVTGQQPALTAAENDPSSELGGSALNQVDAVQQLNTGPFTDEEQKQEQAKFRQQLSARWEQSQSGLTADRQSGLAQKPSSEQNGAEADADADECRHVLSPSKEEGQFSDVGVRGRRTGEAEHARSPSKEEGQCTGSQAEAEQSDSEEEYLDQVDYFGEWSDDDEPANHSKPAKQKNSQDELDQSRLDKIAEILAEREAIKTTINLSFEKLCKQYSIPFELHNLYYQWLMQLQHQGRQRFNEQDIPSQRYSEGKHKHRLYLKPGLKIPAPHGKQWRDLMYSKNLKYSKYNKQTIIKANHMIKQAIHNTAEGIKAVEALTKHWDSQEKIEAHAAKKRRVKASAGAGERQPPASIAKALRDENRTEAFKWLDSINQEFDGLCELGVVEHGFSRRQLREMGITTNPIPFSICLTYKYDKDGSIDRYKSRFALAGHKGNMQQGIHFDKTYSSTPIQHTTKILQAIMVKYKLHRLAFDIKQAYCQADMPEGQQMAVRYPEGFRRYDQDTGEEQFLLLRKNLYGAPQAGRLWEKERNKVLMQVFSQQGWTIKRSRKDPCMFMITKGSIRTWILIWTDDVDMVGEDEVVLQEIFQMINAKWESKQVDASYMLGVKRNITWRDDVMEVELTMTAFVAGMAAAFSDHLIKRTINTPVPDKLFLHKSSKTTEEESKRVLERGYMQLYGMLLWAARGTYPECLIGCSMLGRVMAAPTEEAWHAAVWMLTYLTQHSERGIKYSSAGNAAPVAFTDASNKPDPNDSKCQYGYTHLWMGGPIIAVSKKLNHVGLSAAHNEYQATHWANRHTMWLRDLLTEMDLGDAIQEPTATFGDNRASNLLCEEDIVTCGNQFMQIPFHFNKEVIESGAVTIHYVPTAENIADLYTKAVSKQVLDKLLARALGYSP
jgi:site-specific DNA-cytosine methylase